MDGIDLQRSTLPSLDTFSTPDPLSGFGIMMSSRRISWLMALSSALGSVGPFRWMYLSVVDCRPFKTGFYSAIVRVRKGIVNFNLLYGD